MAMRVLCVCCLWMARCFTAAIIILLWFFHASAAVAGPLQAVESEFVRSSLPSAARTAKFVMPSPSGSSDSPGAAFAALSVPVEFGAEFVPRSLGGGMLKKLRIASTFIYRYVILY
jgi:hypothetical protein